MEEGFGVDGSADYQDDSQDCLSSCSEILSDSAQSANTICILRDCQDNFMGHSDNNKSKTHLDSLPVQSKGNEYNNFRFLSNSQEIHNYSKEQGCKKII